MSYLPEIKDGQIVSREEIRRVLQLMKTRYEKKCEDNLEALNNLEHDIIKEDFSDDRVPNGNTREKPCKNCGETIFREESVGSQGWINTKYCSRTCRNEFLKKRRNGEE